jgi:hypothetical protein
MQNKSTQEGFGYKGFGAGCPHLSAFVCVCLLGELN